MIGPNSLSETLGKSPVTTNSAFATKRTMNPQKRKKWLRPKPSETTRLWKNA